MLAVSFGEGRIYKPIGICFGILYPEVENIVKVIALKDNARVLPTGETKQNIKNLFK